MPERIELYFLAAAVVVAAGAAYARQLTAMTSDKSVPGWRMTLGAVIGGAIVGGVAYIVVLEWRPKALMLGLAAAALMGLSGEKGIHVLVDMVTDFARWKMGTRPGGGEAGPSPSLPPVEPEATEDEDSTRE